MEVDGYTVVERWGVHEVLEFVSRELRTHTWLVRLYYGLLVAAIAYGIFLGARDYRAGAKVFADIATPFGLGVAGMLLLVVPHELIHGAAFRLLGAPRVVYGAVWRKFVFHASAPGFAVGHRAMWIVAFAPFVVINTALLVAMFSASGMWTWGWYGALLAHLQGCIGDVAIVSFFVRQRRASEWLTWDEEEGGEFAFARKTPPSRRVGKMA